MTTAVLTARLEPRDLANKALAGAAKLWLLVAVIGQWAFFYYIFAMYGASTLTGHFEAWRRNHMLFKGYVPHDTAGNLAFGAHALLAGIIAFGGAIQLFPQIQRRAAFIHRWNGRLFVVTALAVSATGLYMDWVRHANANLLNALSTSLNAVLIIACVLVAWRLAVARRIAGHRRWALRAYMVANGQWFFRVAMFAWITLNQGPVGVGDNLDGSVAVFLEFGCYLVPLAMLELYLRAKAGTRQSGQVAMAVSLLVCTAYMAVGIAGFTMISLPMLSRAGG